MPKKAFTLLELIIVIIIIGILATLGFNQYIKMVEYGRTSEARMILGQLRTAEIAYYQEHGEYSSLSPVYPVNYLGIDVPVGSCRPTHYFQYGCSTLSCQAGRCTKGGKTPNAKQVPALYYPGSDSPPAYLIFINIATGNFSDNFKYYNP